MPLDHAQRVLRSRHAAFAQHARHSAVATTAAARAARDARFIDEVDPDRVLPESERARRAKAARKAFFLDLAFRSARARKHKAESGHATQETADDLRILTRALLEAAAALGDASAADDAAELA
jgi:hypothetical protein